MRIKKLLGKKKIVAIIPARGGSKRLPKKNILILNGISLIEYSIKVAQNCVAIDKVIVSTDDSKIANLAKRFGCEVDIRSDELSSDTATTIDVLKDLLKRLDDYDVCVTLQPTSPLRTLEDVQGCLNLFEKKNADAVISVCKAEHPPDWINTIGINGEMDKFLCKSVKNKLSQDLGDFYRLNGAVYCNNIRRLIKENTLFFSSHSYAYIMPSKRSIDIDTLEDFELAEYLISKTYL